MRVVILGANGLLGQSLLSLPTIKKHTIFPLDQQELDITDTKAVVQRFDEIEPELIVNVAAFNAVDMAESSAEGRQSAFRINADAVGVLAKVAHTVGATFVHYSTDYVFDGTSEVPYIETDTPNPLSVYGESKCKGEEYVLREIDSGLKGYVIRTSRLFGGANTKRHGKESFPDLVLRLCGEKRRLEFIDGFEIASPTFATDLAVASLELIASSVPVGLYHRTNSGEASWYAFASEVIASSRQYTIDYTDSSRTHIDLVKISSLPSRPAPRPKYSVLGTTKVAPLRPWQEAVREYMSQRDRAII